MSNVVAIPRSENLRTYVGRVTTESNTTGVTFVGIRCESIKPTNNVPSLPKVVGGNLECPTDYEVLKLTRSSPLYMPIQPSKLKLSPPPSLPSRIPLQPIPKIPVDPDSYRLPTLPPVSPDR